MSSNFAFNNGMTIQIPAFNAASDQLFLEIKNYLDSRFNEVEDKMNEIMCKNNEIGDYLMKIERDIEDLRSHKDGGKKSKNEDRMRMCFNKKNIFKPLKRKMFSTKLLKTSVLVKTKEEPKVNTTLENFFLTGLNNGSQNTAAETILDPGTIHTETTEVNEDSSLRDEALEPVVILNPVDKREVFIGGNSTVKLSFWAYKKCLSCIRGKPNELSSRLCLRLLQAKFGRMYMLSHNYNGSGDKLPIDRVIMQAILSQVKMQFPNQEDMQNNPARFAMFRDYINNAFRVVAYRHRKGIQSNTPFWDQNGEPITDLDPPTWIGENMK